MQEAGHVALAAAVDSTVRTLVYKLEADWNRNGLYDHDLSDLTQVVESLSVSSDITQALPLETTMIEGFHSSRLDVRLGGTRDGDSLSIAKLLSPWREDSPLYNTGRVGVTVRAWIGLVPPGEDEVQVQQFQGELLQPSFSGSGGEVTFVCLDSEKMQKNIDLPVFAVAPNSVRTYGLNLMLKTNSQWVLDYIFRKCGYYMSPPPHARTFYSATMHGGPAPEIGHQSFFWIGDGSASETEQVYWPGRPGWGLAYGGSHRWWGAVQSRGVPTAFRAYPSQTLCIQFQVDTSKAPGVFPGQPGNVVSWSSGNGYLSGTSFIVNIDAVGHMLVDCYNGGTKVATVDGPFLGTAGWVDAWCEIELSSTFSSCTFRFPGKTVTGVNLTSLPTSPSVSAYSHVLVFNQMPIHDLQLSDRTGLASGATRYDPTTWEPQVDLDTGLNDLTGLPLRRGVNAWSLAKEVVGAEYGVLGFSESGRPFFRNRDTVRRSGLTTVKTLTEEKVLVEFGLSEQAGSVRNSITASYAPRLMAGPLDSWDSWSAIWELKDPGDVLIGSGTLILDVTLDEPARVDAYASLAHLTTAQWNDTNNTISSRHGYVTRRADGLAEVTSGVTARVDPLGPEFGSDDRIRIYISNNSGHWLRLMTSDGSPALRVRGNRYYFGSERTETVRRESSIAKYGEKTLAIPKSEWHQTASSVRTISRSLLKDLKSPVPVIDQVVAVGDPRLQLEDTVLVEDRGGLGGPMLAIVTGIKRVLETSGSGAKLVDYLTLRPVSAPGKWILGHPEQSVLGSTTVL